MGGKWSFKEIVKIGGKLVVGVSVANLYSSQFVDIMGYSNRSFFIIGSVWAFYLALATALLIAHFCSLLTLFKCLPQRIIP